MSVCSKALTLTIGSGSETIHLANPAPYIVLTGMTTVYTATITPANTHTVTFKEKVFPFAGNVIGTVPAVAGVAVLNKTWAVADLSAPGYHVVQAIDGTYLSNFSTTVQVVVPNQLDVPWEFTDSFDGWEYSYLTLGPVRLTRTVNTSTHYRWENGGVGLPYHNTPPTIEWWLKFVMDASLSGGVWTIYYYYTVYEPTFWPGGPAYGSMEFDAASGQIGSNPLGNYARGNVGGHDTGIPSLMTNGVISTWLP